MMKKMKKRLSALLALLLSCVFLFAFAEEEKSVVFTFFQMEGFESQEIGDSCLIQFPDGETMLVDTLEPVCEDALVRTLKQMGVQKLDALLLTHMHIDHIGGAAKILYTFPVDALYGPGEPYYSKTYKGYALAQALKGVREQTLKRGDTVKFGDVTLQILNPEITPEIHEKFASDTITVAESNQYSIVFRLEYGDFSALFTGDIYQVTEKNLVKLYGDALKSDLLKIPHHANDTSSGSAFLKAVQPKAAVAMGNTVPASWLYNRYIKLGITPYTTLWNGTITVSAYPDGHMDIAAQQTGVKP